MQTVLTANERVQTISCSLSQHLMCAASASSVCSQRPFSLFQLRLTWASPIIPSVSEEENITKTNRNETTPTLAFHHLTCNVVLYLSQQQAERITMRNIQVFQSLSWTVSPNHNRIIISKPSSCRHRGPRPDNTLELIFYDPQRGVDGDL